MSYIYLLPLGLAFILGMLVLGQTTAEQNLKLSSKAKPFTNNLSNRLYELSYLVPFKWFINEKEDDKKSRNVIKLINESEMGRLLDYRVFTTVQTGILIFSTILFLIFNVIVNNSPVIVKSLFNIQIDISDSQVLTEVKVITAMGLLFLCILPKLYLKITAKKNRYNFLKGFSILQLFIILMLKAQRPLSEVLYVLSTTNTIYKKIFANAYRIYVRNNQEGMGFLLKAFENTKFEDTIKVLCDYNEYSKKDTLIVLENGLEQITEYTNTLRTRKNIGYNVISQVSLVVPFLGFMLLGLTPIIYYGINLISIQ